MSKLRYFLITNNLTNKIINENSFSAISYTLKLKRKENNSNLSVIFKLNTFS
ncbi:MAG: hypothetical protein HeimC3_20590 [Candidatus Heimdallarchaeota archaeon LC_3]|nr:MAG: hypothetical protein HeimC3_20590 [Candidatus Heimdallarchaeota archaeon LC_3]